VAVDEVVAGVDAARPKAPVRRKPAARRPEKGGE
jgi:hypothetical protein